MKDMKPMLDGLQRIEDGMKMIQSAQVSWNVQCLVKAYELAIELAPFHVGDRVYLTKAPICSGGWADSKHFLVKDAEGIVINVDIDPDGLSYGVKFTDESWIDDKDIMHKVESANTHMFCFRASWLSKTKGIISIEDQKKMYRERK